MSTYVRGLNEKLERVCTPLGVTTAFRPVRTLRQDLVKVKTPIPEEKKKRVVYEFPCKDCHRVYIGKTKRTLKVRLGEHKQVVRRGISIMALLSMPISPTMPLTGMMPK